MEYVELRSDDGQVWRMRFGMGALRWLEEQTGESFIELAESLGEGRQLSFTTISTLVAAALRHENRNVTLDDADAVIDAAGLGATLDAAMEAFRRSNLMKVADDEAPAADGSATKNAGTGTSSNKRRRTSA